MQKKRPAKKKTASRRAFIRVPFGKGRRITVRTEQGTREFATIDVAVYGISFVAMPEAAKDFHGEMKLDEVTFNIKDHPIQVTARVAYVRKVPGKKHFKVAIEFLKVEANDVFFISKYITEVAGLNKPKTQVKIRMGNKKKRTSSTLRRPRK